MARFSSKTLNPFLREQVVGWQVFYRLVGIELTLKGLVFPEYDEDYSVLIIHPAGLTPVETLKRVCVGLKSSRCPDEGLRNIVGFDLDELALRYPSSSVRNPLFAHKQPDIDLQNDDISSSMDVYEAGLLSLKFLTQKDCYFDNPPNSILCGKSKDSRGFRPYFFAKSGPVLCVSHVEPGPANARALWRVKKG